MVRAQEDVEVRDGSNPNKVHFQKSMKANFFGNSPQKILSCRVSPPKQKMGFIEERKALAMLQQGQGDHEPTKPRIRSVPQTPDRILDAPELRCDFYLNLLDWSSKNFIAVALGETVYLWNAVSGAICVLYTNHDSDNYISSLAWANDGVHLAVGMAANKVQIWDVEAQRKIRTVYSDSGRVAALAWNPSTNQLSTGSRAGSVYGHDVRAQRHHVQTLQGHTQEICGLKWSPDGKMLASGGNDNIVNVWDVNGGCLHRLTEHRAAVKAIAWCPWQSNLLATGGGTACKSIKFWNTGRGTCINTLDTKSQVSALIWNAEHREILSGHGFSENQLTIWKYPTLERVTDLVGHTERVLSMANSPDKTTVVSAGGDETLRFWNCFSSDNKQKKKQRAFAASRSQLYTGIR